MRRFRLRTAEPRCLLGVLALALAPLGVLGCGGGSNKTHHGSTAAGATGGAGGAATSGAGGTSGTSSGAGTGASSGGAGAPGGGGGGVANGSGGSAGGAGMVAAGSAGVPTGGAPSAGMAGTAGTPGLPVSINRPTITGFTIEPNPSSTLSCFVSWTTDADASSEVLFGAGAYEFKIAHDEGVLTHRVLVIGMHAETDYLVKAVSANQGGSMSVEGTFKTGALPANLPVATVKIPDPSVWQAGWTLENIMPPAQGGGRQGTEPGIIAMYDETGAPVWYFVNGTTADERGDVSLRVLSNGNLMVGPSSGEPPKEIDLAGDVVWQGPAQPPTLTPASEDPTLAPMSHYGGKLDNGNYVVLRDNTLNGILGAYIQELTPTNEVAWSWDLFDHLTPPADADLDWCHPNSLTVNLPGDVFYLSCRYQGIIKAKRSGDGAIQWILGGKAGGNFAFDAPEAAFADQHDPEIHSDGTILMYNNGSDQVVRPDGVLTRLLEVSIDETALTAKLNWQFPGTFTVDPWYTDSWYTPYWGDANRLDNGDVLATAGFKSGTQTHVFEVRPADGAVVFELTLPEGYGSYQALRLAPPLIQRL